MWSTTVAGVTRPCRSQYRHNGWRNRYPSRALRQRLPYPRLALLPLPYRQLSDCDGFRFLSAIPLTISPAGIARCQSILSYARSNRTRRTYPSTQYLLIQATLSRHGSNVRTLCTSLTVRRQYRRATCLHLPPPLPTRPHHARQSSANLWRNYCNPYTTRQIKIKIRQKCLDNKTRLSYTTPINSKE